MKSEFIESQMYLESYDGDVTLQIEQWTDDGEVSIVCLTPNYYSMQMTHFEKFKRALKMAWYILRGKEYRLYDILIEDNDKLQEFKDFVAAMNDIPVADRVLEPIKQLVYSHWKGEIE